MNINYELYKIFACVCKNNNITKAANELHITQPSISKSIKNLEEQLGCTLFIRNKYGVSLTNEGKILYDKIKNAVNLVESAEDDIRNILNVEEGTITIGVSNTITRMYLLPYIKEFHRLYPKIKIKIITDPTIKMIPNVRDGLIDILILNLPYPLPNDFSVFDLIELHDIFAASKKEFDNLKNKTIKISELNNYPLILLSNDSNTRYFLDNFMTKNDITLVPDFEFTSYSLVTEFTKAGLGLGFITKEYLSNELNNEELFEITLDKKIPSRKLGVAYLKDKPLSKCSEKFIDLLKNKI